MSKKKTLLTILAVMLVCCIAVTGTLALLTAKSAQPVTNTFQAAGGGELVDSKDGSFVVLEHKVALDESKNDGSYVLTKDLTDPNKDGGDGNSYAVLPNTVVPKDPYVSIVKKTSAPAYLYVEIVNGLADTGLSYVVNSDNWTKLDGVTGNNGGQIYVYKNGTIVTDKTTGLEKINILKDDQVVVSDDLKLTGDTTVDLSFYSYLAQASVGTPTEAFNTCFPKTAA